MKKLLLAALIAAAAVACTKEIPEQLGSEAFVITAGFDEDATRTSLDMNASGNYASVVWNKGDQICVLGYTGRSFYYADFTTQSDGVGVGEFSCHSWAPSGCTMFGAVYPADKLKGFGYSSTEGMDFGLVVPPVQTAVKGGVEKGLIRSVAKVGSSMAPDIKFKNTLALLKFRLAGSAAQYVRKVKLVANSTISGDCMVFIRNNGEIEYDTNRWYIPLEYGQLNSIELQGTFQSGADYYIASLPCESQGFSLLFFNAAGEVMGRYSDKTLPLRRSRITDMGTITLDGAFGEADPNVIRYMKHSKGTRPVTLVVVGDGFMASEQDKFVSMAKSSIDFLFSTEPYKSYKDYFTVYIMKAVSNESGASVTNGKGVITSPKDTYFKSAWGADSYDDMGSDTDKVWGFVASRCPEIQNGTLSIDEVPVLMIINDIRYGGRCHSSSSGRCVAHVSNIRDGAGLSWGFPDVVSDSDEAPGNAHNTTTAERNELGYSSGDWRNAALHEFGGHAFGRLADEYWKGLSYSTGTTIAGHSYPVPYGLNVSGTYSDVPWKTTLLDKLSSLVSIDPLYARIGRFQGADLMIANRWRSEKISCMIDNRQYFSAWQRYLIVKRIMELAGESFSMSAFLDKDVTRDPVRDIASGSLPHTRTADAIPCPPLAPPLFIR